MFLFVVTVFGNTLVCVVVWRYRALHSVSNILIFSLALADLLMAVVFIFRIVVLLSGQEFPKACHGISETGFAVICVIILHLCAISIDRLIAIQYPLRYSTVVSRGRMKVAILFVWVFALSGNLALPHVLPRKQYEDFIKYYDTYHLCITAHKHSFQNTPKILATFIILCYFFIPFVITLSNYVCIMKVSRQQQVRLEQQARLERERVRQLEIKAAITFGIVIGAFMLCFLPLFVGTLYQQFHDPGEQENVTRTMQILSIIASVSACVNPVVYTCRDREFRKSIREILLRKRKANPKCKNQSTDMNVESRGQREIQQVTG